MLRLNYLFLFLLCAGLITSCGDDDEVTVETFDYAVTIMQPTADDKMVGDIMHVHVNFDEADLKTVHNIKVEIKNADDGAVLYEYEEHVHNTSGHHEHHQDVDLADVESGSMFVLEASVWFDASHEEGEEGHEEEEEGHADNFASQSIEFSVN